jgi:chemotaxis protein methyltransferase CheR
MQIGAMSDAKPSLEPAPMLLVNEISHRVLNEYAHAITTLAMARASTTDATARNALGAAERRLRAGANVQRALRPPSDARPRELGAYLETVCASLACTSLRERGVHFTLAPCGVLLGADRCWRVVLIVAELVNTAMRHAFDLGRGQILVEVENLGTTILLRVCDNGRPAASSPPPGRGRRIVESLARVLGGQVEWRFGSSGTTVVLRIPSDSANSADRCA